MAITTLSHEAVSAIAHPLMLANGAFSQRHPGERPERQPVHVMYGGAHLFKADTGPKLGAQALNALQTWAPSGQALGEAVGLSTRLPASDLESIYSRVVGKLRREPVEDFRVDFEDGYGNRPDPEEDGHAEAAAAEAARALAAGSLPPFFGIRIKPLDADRHERSIRTLDIFLTRLTAETGGLLPPGFVVTLPKVTIPEQVAALANLFDLLEVSLQLRLGALRLELMIEAPQAIIDERGDVGLGRLVQAARGRCSAAHLGAYDYTAACNVTSAFQVMSHPACDFARHVMQVSLAGTGVWLSDGATNVMPVPVHRARPGESLTPAQMEDNRRAVWRAWRLHHDDARRSMENGFYQGWDLHPGQLVSRYGAVFGFFHEGLEAASERLRAFVRRAAQGTLVGGIFDDAASGQGLLNYFLRAVNCGALTEEEAVERSGVTLEELRGRSFLQIVTNRRQAR
jgi:citrate lyase beta subunit